MPHWRTWSIPQFVAAVVAMVVVGWLAGQVAGADQRFDTAIRVLARTFQIVIGVVGLYFIFTWAAARDRTRP